MQAEAASAVADMNGEKPLPTMFSTIYCSCPNVDDDNDKDGTPVYLLDNK